MILRFLLVALLSACLTWWYVFVRPSTEEARRVHLYPLLSDRVGRR